jgi:polyisoprenoid-binding protein YceI
MFRLLLLPFSLVLLMSAAVAPQFLATTTTRAYRIQPGSILRLEGKTNVGTFKCACEDQFRQQTFTAHQTSKANFAEFSATALDVRTKSFDCGNKMMNRDLYRALNADQYPTVRIELLRVIENECSLLRDCEGEWVTMKVQMRLTINGQEQEYWLDVTGKKNASADFRFIGSKQLCMSDFGVTPPTAMMGAVKVQDEIRIYFDLAVKVE